MSQWMQFLPPPLRLLNWCEHRLDGKVLLFHRDSGLNVLLEGEETAHIQRVAPRTLLIAVTNACNLTCPFCYRDLKSPSGWRYETLLDFCQQADQWGVLEVAFGGGEPMLFPRWGAFINELYATTQLCINFTTNGMLITEAFLQQIAGKIGQIRVSLYEDNAWEQTIRLLVRTETRFGVNWLITPANLDKMQAQFDHLLALGVRDFLLLGYKGNEFPGMHFRTAADYQRLAAWINAMHAQHGEEITLKLDVCWGNSLPDVPRLFQMDDCGAADDFLSITSDGLIKPCSFMQVGVRVASIEDVKRYWMQRRLAREAALIGGCARLPNRGLTSASSYNQEILKVE